MLEYIIPRCVHQDVPVNQWDTLLGICDPYDTAQRFIVRVYDESGNELAKTLDYTLEPGASVATTFIKGNVFPDPPQNFFGYAKIQFPDGGPFAPAKALPAMAILGGNGAVPKNWNYATPSVPLIGASPMKERGFNSRWVFPYCIPFFDDPNEHHDDHSYRAGISFTNLGINPASLTVAFTRGDFYDFNRRVQFKASVTVAPGQSLARYLHELMPDLLLMNQEGWIDVVADAPTDLLLYLLCGSRDLDWQGFGQAPFVIA